MREDGFVKRCRTAVDEFSKNGELSLAQNCLKKILVIEPDNQTNWFHAGLIEHEWANYEPAVDLYLRGGLIEGFARSARTLLNQLKRANADLAQYRRYFKEAKRVSLDNRAVHLSVEKHLLNQADETMDTPGTLAAAAAIHAPLAEVRILYPRPVTDYLDGDLASLPEGIAFHDMMNAGVICGENLISEPISTCIEPDKLRYVRYNREIGARFDTAFFAGYGAQYFHWSIETTHNIRLYIENKLDVPLLVHGPKPQKFHREMINILGLSEKAHHVLSNPGIILTKNLIVTRYVGATHRMEPDHIFWLRDTMLERVPESKSMTGAEKLYISRGDTRRKRITREDVLIDLLRDRGFSILELARMSLSEQIAAFSQARVVVAPHGAGLTNVIYCSENTKVIELTPTADPRLNYFERLSGIVGARHIYVKSTDAENVTHLGLPHDAPARFDHAEILCAIHNG